jgi:hypothetical protein
MSRWARALLSVAVVCVSAAATLFVLEFAVRWVIPQYDPSGHLSFVPGDATRPPLGRPDTEQRQIKNTGDFDVTVRFNKYGFRDDRDLARSTAEDFFAVGDSLAFGWGVEERDRVTERLEKIIDRPVFNISIPASLDRMEKLIDYAKLQGATVRRIIVFFSMEVRLVSTTGATPRRDGSEIKGLLSKVKQTLMTKSALYFLFTTHVHRTPALKDLAVRMGLIQPNLSGFPYHAFDAAQIEKAARELARIAAPKDRWVVFAILPARTLWIGPTREVEDRIHRTLVGRLVEMGLDVVDLRPAFEAGGKPLDYFFKNDGHWNPNGHALVAGSIARHLAANTGRP